jgi:uncharacterized protein YndB with AHSA1/START domain
MSVPGAGVEVRRRLSASTEKVFAAFSNATLVAKWLRPSPHVMLTVLEFDLRPGGAYRFAYDVPGREAHDRGRHVSLDRPPTRIVFSWLIEPPDEHAGIDSEVTVTLVSRGDATDLTIRHAKFGRADVDERHAEGWRGALELLDALASGAEA